MKKPLLLVLIILLADQLIKFYVKTHFFLGEEVHVFGNWFILHFTENNGMAYGMEFGGTWGKLFLSSFRIVAVTALGWYLFSLIKKNEDKLYIICIALIFAGAFGNIVDSAFYGILFSDSNYEVARFLPQEGGYSNFLHGKVVDMLYFPVIETHYPQWFPFWGGEDFVFFRPVFNLADSSISVGVAIIILNQKRFFSKKKSSEEVKLETEKISESVENQNPKEPIPET